MEEHIKNHSANISLQENEAFIQSIVMPDSEKVKAMSDLNLLGITDKSLCLDSADGFADLANKCKELADRYFPHS